MFDPLSITRFYNKKLLEHFQKKGDIVFNLIILSYNI